ncbi:MAG: CDP-alcohol phosphatidyltransferase family protein [Alphaproteobacteria bacterium]|nr:CDP-alcohol phosphatidyltransferase family protein [Alphaproteobacteria bacterium]
MSHNTWIHKVSRLGVRPLVNTAVTPNQITTLRLACGIASAALVASGEASLIAWGAGLFLVSMVLDRADGELARLSGKTSPWGHRYDLIADSLSNALIFVGLGIGLRDGFFGIWSIPMGFLAGAAVASILWLVMRAEALQGARAAEISGSGGFDPDDGMLAIPVLIWLGLSQVLLALAAIGAPAFAIFFFLKFRKFLFGPSAGQD